MWPDRASWCIFLLLASSLGGGLTLTSGEVGNFNGTLTTETEEQRIIGGTLTGITEHPYQIALLYNGRFFCGGSIIGLKWVLTSAHCTDQIATSSLSVRAGSTYHDDGGQILKVAQVFQHPKYDPETAYYDLSVLQLASSFTYGSSIQAVSLPAQGAIPKVGQQGVVTGWGRTSEGGSTSRRLIEVSLPVISQDECRSVYGKEKVTDRMICAGHADGGQDACQGDSGGPFVKEGADGAGRTLIGIVSWGYGCARPRYAGVFTRVSAFTSYIKGIMQK